MKVFLLRITLLIVILSLLSAGCGRESSHVAGIVTSADTGNPLQGAQVRIDEGTATTDAKGHYDIKNVPEGNRLLEADAEGYVPFSRTISVEPGLRVVLDIELEPVHVGSATIQGSVRDTGTDSPIVGAFVSIGTSQRETGQQGDFKFVGLEVGEHKLTITADGYKPYSRDLTVEEGVSVVLHIALSNEEDVASQTPADAAAEVPEESPTVEDTVAHLTGTTESLPQEPSAPKFDEEVPAAIAETSPPEVTPKPYCAIEMSGPSEFPLCGWLGIQEIHDGDISPDGKYVALSTEFGVEIRELESLSFCSAIPSGSTSAVAFSPDGRFIAQVLDTNSSVTSLLVREFDTGEVLTSTMIYAAKAVSFLGEGDRIVVDSGGEIACIDWTTESWLWQFDASWHPVWSVSADERCLAYYNKERIVVYDLEKEEEYTSWPLEERPGVTVFSRDGKLLATGGEDKRAKIWDVAEGKCLKDFWWHETAIKSLSFSSDANLLAVGCDNGVIRVWDIESEEYLYTWRMEGSVSFLSFCMGDRHIVAGSSKGECSLWDVKTGSCISSIPPLLTNVYIDGITFLTKRLLAVAEHRHERYRISTWDVFSRVRLHSFDIPCEVQYMAALPNGDLVTVLDDRTVTTWDPLTGALLGNVSIRSEAARRYAVCSALGVFAFAVGSSVEVWDVETGTALWSFQASENVAFPLAFSDDGKKLAITVTDKEGKVMEIWDIGSRTCTSKFELPESAGYRICFSLPMAVCSQVRILKHAQPWYGT